MATSFDPTAPMKPSYAPNVVNQTVEMGGNVWKGQPGGDWTLQSSGGSTGSTDTGTSGAGGVAGTGFNLPDFSGIVNQQRQATSGLLSGQQAQIGDYLQGYRNAIGGQETQQAMWNRLAQETGYPQLMQQATTLNNQLAMIPQTQISATRGYDVNANQLDRLMNMQQWKLAPLAQRATAQAQTAGQLMSGQIAATQAQQQKELLPYQAQQALLTDQLARQATMFTSQNESELQGLEYAMQTGAQLTSGQLDRYNELKKAQIAYNQAISTANIAQMYRTLSPAQGVFNAVTGTVTPYNYTGPTVPGVPSNP